MHLDDALHDREPEAAAAPARLARARPAEEPVEDPWQLGRVDADARVGDADLGTAIARRPDRDMDRSAAVRELQGVADEVRDNLADPDRIMPDPDRLLRERDLEVDAAASRGRGRLL